MTAIGFIGSGRQGATVARLAVAAGYDVILSNSRGPLTLRDLVEQLGSHARAATPAEAAAAGGLVVISLPPRAYPAVPVQPLAGKTVLDTINYIPERYGRQQRGAATAPGYRPRDQGVQQHHLLAPRLAGPPGWLGRPKRPANRRRRPGRQGSRDEVHRYDRVRRR
jgi:hypothetical protein